MSGALWHREGLIADAVNMLVWRPVYRERHSGGHVSFFLGRDRRPIAAEQPRSGEPDPRQDLTRPPSDQPARHRGARKHEAR